MTSVSQILIRYNQQRRALLYFISGLMLVAGIGIIFKSFSKKPFLHPMVLPLGILLLLGFGALVYFARRWFANKTVLVIDDDGITDNLSSASLGFISWKDVIEIKKKKIMGRKVICIFVNNPDDYYKKATTPLQHKKLELNKANCETPLVISAKGLSVDYYTLIEIIQRKKNLYNEKENFLNDEQIPVNL